MAYEKYLHRIEYDDKCYYILSTHAELEYVLALAQASCKIDEFELPLSIQKVNMRHLKWYNPHLYYRYNNFSGFFVTTHKPKKSEVHVLDFSMLCDTKFVVVNVRQNLIDDILKELNFIQ